MAATVMATAAAAARVQKQRQFVEHRDPIFPARPLLGRGVSWDSCTKHRGILQNQWRLCTWTPCDEGAKAGPRFLTHWLSSWCVLTFFKRDPSLCSLSLCRQNGFSFCVRLGVLVRRPARCRVAYLRFLFGSDGKMLGGTHTRSAKAPPPPFERLFGVDDRT